MRKKEFTADLNFCSVSGDGIILTELNVDEGNCIWTYLISRK